MLTIELPSMLALSDSGTYWQIALVEAAIILLFVLILVLILAPDYAQNADAQVQRGFRRLRFWSLWIWNRINTTWLLKNRARYAYEAEAALRRQRRRQDDIQKAIRAKTPPGQPVDYGSMKGFMPLPSLPLVSETTTIIMLAWIRRFLYMLCALISILGDLVLAASQIGPILFGGDVASALIPLLQLLPFFVSITLIANFILSGILISEYSRYLPEVLKVTATMPPIQRRMRHLVSISTLIGGIIVIIAFWAVWNNIELVSNVSLLQEALTAHIGIGIVAIINAFLAQDGFFQALASMVILTIGVPIGLVLMFLMSILTALSVTLTRMDRLGQSIRRGPKRPYNHSKGSSKYPDLSVVGFGDEGSKWAAEVCKQCALLYSRRSLWMAGIYALYDRRYATYHNTLKESDACLMDISIAPDQANPGLELRKKLQQQYRDHGKSVLHKTLLWLVSGKDLGGCLAELQRLGQENTEIKLVILWVLPLKIDQEALDLAEELRQWAKQPDSILTTTIVIDRKDPLASWMKTPQEPLLVRSIAALLGASEHDGEVSRFTDLVVALKQAHYPFAALASGSIGLNFTLSSHSKRQAHAKATGDIDPTQAADTLYILAKAVFSEQNLATVSDIPKTARAVHIVLPASRHEQVKVFINEIKPWFRGRFGINPNQISVITARPDDHGVDVSSRRIEWTGDTYLHLTVLFGIGNGADTIPEDVM